MGLFDTKITCVVCENEVGLDRNKTKHGLICRNCMNILLKKKIYILNIKKYDLEDLKKIVKEDNVSFTQNPKYVEIKNEAGLEETTSKEPITNEIALDDTINNLDEILYCHNCGKKILGESKFCPQCGCKINNMNLKNLKPRIQNTATYTVKNKFCCPRCNGNNIDLASTDKNMKVTQKTSLNLNPLRPFTVFNTKTVTKEKKSASKIGLGLMTGGASLLVTGVNNKNHSEYFCRDCGNRWVGK